MCDPLGLFLQKREACGAPPGQGGLGGGDAGQDVGQKLLLDAHGALAVPDLAFQLRGGAHDDEVAGGLVLEHGRAAGAAAAPLMQRG